MIYLFAIVYAIYVASVVRDARRNDSSTVPSDEGRRDRRREEERRDGRGEEERRDGRGRRGFEATRWLEDEVLPVLFGNVVLQEGVWLLLSVPRFVISPLVVSGTKHVCLGILFYVVLATNPDLFWSQLSKLCFYATLVDLAFWWRIPTMFAFLLLDAALMEAIVVAVRTRPLGSEKRRKVDGG